MKTMKSVWASYSPAMRAAYVVVFGLGAGVMLADTCELVLVLAGVWVR